MSTPFEALHPAVQHHVVNSLGWRSLRPLQEQSILPILEGRDVLLGAPTAGGKTEAAILPLLSRMVSEEWAGLSVLYVCPLRALLNNLHPRISGYAELVGRTAGLWHGDVGDGPRKRMLRDPPDMLLTTPESLEAMFLSRRVDAAQLLGGVRAVVVDEIHAFAGDDRGWHMLAVLDRIDALSPGRAQRLGLTATVGNPDHLLGWLSRRPVDDRETVMVHDGAVAPELTVDWVASVDNAARVIAGLHHGEKRLVFCDSRARVEELATALRRLEVTTFVSHSSLSRDERRQAEQAFAEASNCVIVSTSTLELGIDVGDLDRVIQIDSPARVSSVLQRMGRTGRRAGTKRNCLFLCTNELALLQSIAVCELIHQGWVEPVVGPPRPLHLVVQQLLARVLADGRVGDTAWPGELTDVARLAELTPAEVLEVRTELERIDVLLRDGGFVQIGQVGEERYGRRHFMDVTSLFLTEPLLKVRWGTRELGQVDPSVLTTRDGRKATILLGGRAWDVEDVDWRRGIGWVKPSEEAGRSRWSGSGVALSAVVCRAIRAVLATSVEPEGAVLTARARAQLAALRGDFDGVRDGRTMLVRDGGRNRETWWTFAGGNANAALAAGLAAANIGVMGSDDLSISMRGPVGYERLRQLLVDLRAAPPRAAPDERRIEALKFGESLPVDLALSVLAARMADEAAVVSALDEPLLSVTEV
ncbi:DNA helicase [Paraconexibacter sp. AEG42_29]|uniref:DNA helicase n=1 Tax=Paraconexibacter sp. AEG42_29 TaxID=2997339 RepID=A0AAU7B1V9_9ACTN